jgi:cytochrome P450
MPENNFDCDDFDKIDIHVQEFSRDPYPTYDALRQHCPVMHSDKYGSFWMFTRYEDVQAAALDWRSYTSSVVGVTAIPIITPRTQPMLPIELDPPLHSRYRALVNPVFSRERVEALRPTIVALVDELFDGLAGKAQVDLVTAYAMPLSVRTLAAFTGLPKGDTHLWVEWLQRMFNVHNPEDGKVASQTFGRYIDDLIAARRQQPTDDFISLLIASEVDGHRLTDGELHSFSTVVFGAGFETTADTLSVMLLWLAEHPDEMTRLVAQPALIPTAVEEFLRYASSIQIFGRNAAHDLDVHGRRIPAGDIVALAFGAANHDPSVFAEPGQCKIDRTPNKHLTFGAGVHICLGAPIARMELQVTLEAFVRRLPRLRLAEQGEPHWKTRGDRRGLSQLIVEIE